MEANSIRTLFRNAKSLETLEYDLKLVGENFTPERLAVLISTSYEIGRGVFDEGYQALIDEAIRLSNKLALEILWKGIYYHDRDNPDFGPNLRLAAEVSTLDVFKFVLHAYQTWATLDEKDEIPIVTLVAKAKNNPDPKVLEFILDLSIPVSEFLNLIKEWDDPEISGFEKGILVLHAKTIVN